MENKEINYDSVCKNCGEIITEHKAHNYRCSEVDRYRKGWLSTTFEKMPKKSIGELKEEFYEKFELADEKPIWLNTTQLNDVWQWIKENSKP